MARKPREYGEYIHVMNRGTGKQILFEDNEDRYKFLYLLARFKKECKITIIAYCLMENHFHLLIKDSHKSISRYMKKVEMCYVQYFNKKYSRIGGLFQGRYYSCVVKSDEQLVQTYRYILKNPEKAGIASADGYKWNSYSDYGKIGKLTNTTLIQQIIGNYKNFIHFMSKNDLKEYMDFDSEKHDDNWALKIIRETLSVVSGTALQAMSREQRNKSLTKLIKNNLKISQIERLTGISRNVITRVCSIS